MSEANVHRTVLLSYPAVMGGIEFRVEKWWLPLDCEEESVTRFALVWSVPEDENEQVVLLGPKRAKEVAEILLGE